MERLIDTNQQQWQPVRPDLTAGITGKLLLEGPTRMVLTRVRPGGVFHPHRDSYRHLFHILYGQGAFQVEGEQMILTAGLTLQVEAGELHGYENHGEDDLLLLSLNLPPQ